MPVSFPNALSHTWERHGIPDPAITRFSNAQGLNVHRTKDEVLFQGKYNLKKKDGNNGDELSDNHKDYLNRLEAAKQERLQLGQLNRNMLSHFKQKKIDVLNLKHYIDQGADIDAQDEEGNTISHYAVSKDFLGNGSISDFEKQCKQLKNILSLYKPNVNITNNKDETPLLSAIRVMRQVCFRDWPDAIEILCANGALLRRTDLAEAANNTLPISRFSKGLIQALLENHRSKQIQTKQGRDAYFNNKLPENSEKENKALTSSFNFLERFKKHS
jgi:hypothetical protein